MAKPEDDGSCSQVAGAFTAALFLRAQRSLSQRPSQRHLRRARRAHSAHSTREQSGKIGAEALYAYLKKNHGITMPHSRVPPIKVRTIATTIPKSSRWSRFIRAIATATSTRARREPQRGITSPRRKAGGSLPGSGGMRWPKGTSWECSPAPTTGLRTFPYACLLAENFTREGLLDAIRKRHAYGATDNIVMDFRATAGGLEHFMGDAFTGTAEPKFTVHVIGTDPIKQFDLIKDKKFIYTSRPGTRQLSVAIHRHATHTGRKLVLRESPAGRWAASLEFTRVDQAPITITSTLVSVFAAFWVAGTRKVGGVEAVTSRPAGISG